MPVIDAHQHFWKLDQEPFDYSWMNKPGLEPLRHDRMPEDLAPLIRKAGVDKTVVVQTQHKLAENDWALDLADDHEFIAGVVGWVDLTSTNVERDLVGALENEKFVGVRHVTHDEPDDDWIIRDDVLRGLKVLEKYVVPFDLLFYVKHLPHAKTLAEKFPGLPMVIDHLAKPDIKAHRTDGWREPFETAARYPNMFCKLSGMITEADWSRWRSADLKPYVQIALEAFGPDRCMFGTDWPVCTLAGSYEQAKRSLEEALGPISEAERADIFGNTAARFYELL